MKEFTVRRNRRTGYPVKNRPNELLRHQQHSLQHVVFGRCNDRAIDSTVPLQCPICSEIKPIVDFTEDHSPQRGQNSRRFGAKPWVVVLCCRDCNHQAGKSYEKYASGLQRGTMAVEGSHKCTVHGNLPKRFLDLPGYTPAGVVDSSDLKTAFMIAYAVLGLRWATQPALEPVRSAILTGKRLEPRHGSVGRFIQANRMPAERQVLMVFKPQAAVYVVGLDGHAAKLPFCDAVDLREQVSGRTLSYPPIDWPYLAEAHQHVELSFLAGQLFLLDQPDAADHIGELSAA